MVDDLEVEVVRKKVKNLNLSVLPPEGKVRVVIPKYATLKEAKALVSAHLDWIAKQKKAIEALPKVPVLHAQSGEQHLLWGEKFPLEVIERRGRQNIVFIDNKILLLCKPGATQANRFKILDDWYRVEISKRVPALLDKWQVIIGEQVNEWGIKKMTTRWGTCNICDRRIWLSLALAKKPLECLEYIFVHEMVHLLERRHNARFKSLMTQFLPEWRDLDLRLK